MLNNAGKEMVVKAGLIVAGADGEVSEEELALLAGIAVRLDPPEGIQRQVLRNPTEGGSGRLRAIPEPRLRRPTDGKRDA